MLVRINNDGEEKKVFFLSGGGGIAVNYSVFINRYHGPGLL